MVTLEVVACVCWAAVWFAAVAWAVQGDDPPRRGPPGGWGDGQW